MKQPKLILSVLILCLIAFEQHVEAAGKNAVRRGNKKLIEFGWDEPDTAFMRQHIAEMENTPFDGCVFHVLTKKTENAPSVNLIWEGWGQRVFTDADVQHAVEDLKATPFKRFTHNFLRFNTTPGELDWFDDHTAVINNARLSARIAREGKCAGVLFDVEQYNGKLFTYQKQRDAATKSWDEYAAKARQRGREVMEAFQEGYPNLVLLLTFGHSFPLAGGKEQTLHAAEYGMLAPFLDGMVDAVKGKARLVDGHELSYSYREPAQYVEAYQKMTRDVLPLIPDPERYRQVYSFGFGIWLDYDWRKHGWDTNDTSKNYFTPKVLQTVVRKALETSDEYVWIYTETPRWWSEGGGPEKLPQAYIEALWEARKGLAK